MQKSSPFMIMQMAKSKNIQTILKHAKSRKKKVQRSNLPFTHSYNIYLPSIWIQLDIKFTDWVMTMQKFGVKSTIFFLLSRNSAKNK